MLGQLYVIWNEIVNNASLAYEDLLKAMNQCMQSIVISKELIEELRQNQAVDIEFDSWDFILQMEMLEDKIGGFKISLIAYGDIENFEEIIHQSMENRGVSFEEISGFEAENGLDIIQEFEERVIENFGIKADITEEGIFFELIIFDSQDIDNNTKFNSETSTEKGRGEWIGETFRAM